MTQRRVATPVSDTDLIYSPDTYVRGVPYDALARLRGSTPVVWIEERPADHEPAGFWAVLRHADACHVLHNPKLFAARGSADDDSGHGRGSTSAAAPPVRSRLRRRLPRAFGARNVEGLAERIERRAYALVDAVAEKGEADFATEIAADLPLLSFADLLGVPDSDRWLLSDWSDRVTGRPVAGYPVGYSPETTADPAACTEMARRAVAARPHGPLDPETAAPGGPGTEATARGGQGAGAAQGGPDAGATAPDGSGAETDGGLPDLRLYAGELAEYKRRHPAEDLMTVLVQHSGGKNGPVPAEEFESLFRMFAAAANHTVQGGLSGGMLALLKNPAEVSRLRADPGLLDGTVEEVLRWWSPVIRVGRTATADTVVGNVPVRKGERLVVWLASANRDEPVFEEPARFDVGRAPNDHVALGRGPRACLGAHLVRMQMRAMFAAVLDRFDAIEPAGDARRLRSSVHNGITHLPIRWQPRGRAPEAFGTRSA
ncbi:cytochrome P450 [Actinoallomurus rhizosphaericola]|uniref:cytochrome P450 n=1 Tax=Actinoallomurus rhizosphaericola TaxID=2952536 RepID=UPI00209308DC|nr:cytochrome P450 [Actinoallomurus rhizosphaericola]MCO5997782.1 cytochrome P450 [Actinoallomurus rhizosphaericola]